MAKMLASVIVAAYNAERTLARCIESILAQDFPKDEFEFIIVDNNSTDKTSEIIKHYPVKYLFEKKRGPAAARNPGIAAARGKFIAFTDSDCIAKEDWLRQGIDGFKEEKTGIVSGRVLSSDPENMFERIIAERDEYNIPEDYHRQPPYAIMANAFFRREVFAAIGTFDVSQICGEDLDICWRMQEKTDFILVRRPEAIVYHKHRSSLKSYFRQYFYYGIYNRMLMKKHPKAFRKTITKGLWEELVSITKQAVFVPKVYWMTANDENKEYIRALHLMNLARQSAFYFGRLLGRLKVFTS